MIHHAYKRQINKISEILGSFAGLAEENGRILFLSDSGEPVPEEARAGGKSLEPDVEAELKLYCCSEGDAPENKNGLFVKNVYTKSEESYLLFAIIKDMPSTAAKRFMAMAGEAFESYEDDELTKERDQLTLDIKEILSGGQLSFQDNEYCKRQLNGDKTGLKGYMVALIRTKGVPYGQMLLETVQNILPKERGFFVVQQNQASVCVVCVVWDGLNVQMIHKISAEIKDTILSELMMDVSVSLSPVVGSVSNLGDALKKAGIVDRIGEEFSLSEKVYSYSEMGLPKLIYNIPRENCEEFIEETLGRDFINDKSSEELLTTMQVFLEYNQNVSEASRALYIHRNTLLYRLDKFKKLTGIDCFGFIEGMKVGLSLIIIRYLNGKV